MLVEGVLQAVINRIHVQPALLCVDAICASCNSVVCDGCFVHEVSQQHVCTRTTAHALQAPALQHHTVGLVVLFHTALLAGFVARRQNACSWFALMTGNAGPKDRKTVWRPVVCAKSSSRQDSNAVSVALLACGVVCC